MTDKQRQPITLSSHLKLKKLPYEKKMINYTFKKTILWWKYFNLFFVSEKVLVPNFRFQFKTVPEKPCMHITLHQLRSSLWLAVNYYIYPNLVSAQSSLELYVSVWTRKCFKTMLLYVSDKDIKCMMSFLFFDKKQCLATKSVDKVFCAVD